MEANKQNADFLHIGKKIVHWFAGNSRDLPFRKTKNPYHIWICEIIFQQTRIQQGLQHYNNFVERFPDVFSLAKAAPDEVLLYWKGLGYYSRALNIHKTAKILVEKYGGHFPEYYPEILKLPGIGKYTASAICSICFSEKLPAVDGNFYRVLSRIFADDFDISSPKAFDYFTNLALRIMPENNPGTFNQAMMDLGSEVCTPKNPKCGICPVNIDCLAYNLGKISEFPVKISRAKVTDLALSFYFVKFQDKFLIKKRGTDFIWKNLYEFPTEIPENFQKFVQKPTEIRHKLTHKNLTITIVPIILEDENLFKNFAKEFDFQTASKESAGQKSFPKPLQSYLEGFEF